MPPHGRIHYEGAFAVLDLDHTLAPWLLGDVVLLQSLNGLLNGKLMRVLQVEPVRNDPDPYALMA
ncbi:hypothetical protein ACWFRJ_42325 [Streptomyces sp. NPDC055239]